MVYALREIWRVLTPGGSLIDLRPLAGNSLLEVVTSEGVRLAGRINDTLDIPDDRAANEALAHVVGAGWFARQRKVNFNYAVYCDTPDEVRTYLETKRRSLFLSGAVLDRARQLLAGSSEGAKMRVRFKMVIGRYQKLGR